MRPLVVLVILACATFFQAPAPPAASMRETYAELPGVRLWYVDSGGDGVPVVFLHAATGSVRAWEHQVPAFTAAGYRFIAFDRRGFGRTAPATGGAQPASTAADDLHALVDHLRLDRVHLVGTAAGGFVAFDYALSFPRQLRSVVVANSIGGVIDEEYIALGRRIRPPAFNALPADVRELGPSYRAANPDGTKRWSELERTNRLAGEPPPPQTMKNRITFALLQTIDTPTLLLTGGADLYAPPPVMQLFAARIKGAESAVVPDAGHSTYWEQPDVFNRTVLAFIRKH